MGSMCLPKSEEFINACSRILRNNTEYACQKIEIYYDASFYNMRDYTFRCTLDNEWGYSVNDIKKSLKEAGACDIIGKGKKSGSYTYVDIAFNRVVKTLEFKDEYDCKKTLFGDTIIMRGLSDWEKECAIAQWFTKKIKIYVGGKQITYTELYDILDIKKRSCYFDRIVKEEGGFVESIKHITVKDLKD